MLLRSLLLLWSGMSALLPLRLDTSSAKTLLLIRHGQTEMNVALDNHVWVIALNHSLAYFCTYSIDFALTYLLS